MRNASDLFSRMVAEANNSANAAETRQICRECAEWIETVILSPAPPKLRRVPFSWFYEATCGRCGAILAGDGDECEECGSKIDWKKF